jgi:hypothetical protein
MNDLSWQMRPFITVIAALGLAAVTQNVSPRPDLFLVADIQKGGCSSDYRKFCSQQSPDEAVQRQPAIAAQAICLRQYWISLSPSCRKALQASKSAAGLEAGGKSGSSQ